MVHINSFLDPFEKRLLSLIQISRKYGIEPVFITQPALYGNAIDDITNVDLGRIKMPIGNGKLAWEILELYNDKTRDVGERENVLVIDAGNKMPKTSQYYYDFIHFTNLYAEKIAEIIFEEIKLFIKQISSNEKQNKFPTRFCLV